MTKNPKIRFAPLIILPAIMPAVLLPVLRSSQISDAALGGIMGIFIGLALVGLSWMIKGNSCSSPDGWVEPLDHLSTGPAFAPASLTDFRDR